MSEGGSEFENGVEVAIMELSVIAGNMRLAKLTTEIVASRLLIINFCYLRIITF